MKGTREPLAAEGLDWLCLLRADGSYEKLEHLGRHADRRDPPEPDKAATARFWAGRRLAMRRSARVAA